MASCLAVDVRYLLAASFDIFRRFSSNAVMIHAKEVFCFRSSFLPRKLHRQRLLSWRSLYFPIRLLILFRVCITIEIDCSSHLQRILYFLSQIVILLEREFADDRWLILSNRWLWIFLLPGLCLFYEIVLNSLKRVTVVRYIKPSSNPI